MSIPDQWTRAALTLFVATALGCSQAEDDPGGTAAAGTMAGNDATAGTTGGDATAGTEAAAGTDTPEAGGAAGTTPVAGDGAAGDDSTAGTEAGASGAAGMDVPVEPPPDTTMLDPEVDWSALTLVYSTMYSAYDGVHTFQVPVYVDGATVELSDWSAIPPTAVTFDADPDLGGVLVTVVEGVPEITIAARSGPVGGAATLHVTTATPEQWEAGEARYNNGIDYEFPAWTLTDIASLLLDPTWEPPTPPPNIACNVCHTTGAKYFEIQHTPTQAARFSDDDLRLILGMGMKPPSIGFRLLPPTLGSKTPEEVYSEFHKWDSTEEEKLGLIVYLRSLTPEGQGDIRLPDGTYVPSGSAPPAGAMP